MRALLQSASFGFFHLVVQPESKNLPPFSQKFLEDLEFLHFLYRQAFCETTASFPRAVKGRAMNITSLPDHVLLSHVETLAARERTATVELITCLAELDERRLYLGVGCSSLFVYCREVLHLSEHAAYGRIQAARCARRFPQILDHLSKGSLTLTAITLLAPVMTERNIDLLLAGAANKSKREIEHLVAVVRPSPPCPTILRKIPATVHPQPSWSPEPTSTAPSPVPSPTALSLAGSQQISSPLSQTSPASHASMAPEGPVDGAESTVIQSTASLPPVVGSLRRATRPGTVQPLTADTYRIQFMLSQDGYKNFRRAQDLMRHRLPSGDPGTIFERALSLLVLQLEKKKHAAIVTPRTHATPRLSGRSGSTSMARSRHIPAAVRRTVWKRDGGRCAFVAASGRRCRETGFLEFHHVVPFADGGQTSAANLQLRCRAHNRHEIELWAPEDHRQPEATALSGLGPGRVAQETLRSSKPPP